jgi:hypothetical protein
MGEFCNSINVTASGFHIGDVNLTRGRIPVDDLLFVRRVVILPRPVPFCLSLPPRVAMPDGMVSPMPDHDTAAF